MKSHLFASTLAVGVLFAAAVTAEAQTPQSQPQKPQAQAQAQSTPAPSLSEVAPHVWVRGRPTKPIFAGAMPIIPEAYDYIHLQDGGR